MLGKVARCRAGSDTRRPKAKAIRLVRDQVAEYPSEWATISTVAGRLGMSAETLRKRLRQQEINDGEVPVSD